VSDLKYIIVIVTGLGDEPLEALDGKTPLEVATTPHLDRISYEGRLGLVNTIDDHHRGGSERALLSLFGYDTRGLGVTRGPLEAAGVGITLEPDDLALRMNFVSTFNGILVDHNAGQISDSESIALVKMLNVRLGGETLSFHAGLGYRNLLVMKGCASLSFETVPPHEILQQPVRDFYPYGADAQVLCDLLERARAELEKNDINSVRIDLGENPANTIWLWGQGRDFELPPFNTMFDLRGGLVGAAPLARGLARKIGLELIDVAGATGGLDTDYARKADGCLEALKRHDLVVVHVGAVNEACHEGNPSSKIAAIEAVDSRLVGPLLEKLDGLDGWRMMIATDHITSTLETTRARGPVPVAFCGQGVEGIRQYAFTEANAAKSDLHVDNGHDLMEFFLGIPRKKRP